MTLWLSDPVSLSAKMDFSRLNPEQLTQLQSLFNQTLPPTPPVNGNTSTQSSLKSTSLPMAASQPPLDNPPSQLGGSSSQSPSQTTHSHPPPVTRLTDPIGPYQSLCSTPFASQGYPSTAVTTIPAVSGLSSQPFLVASQGHPSTAVTTIPAVGSPSSQPFLGLDRLGLSMAGQVNQRRLASAAATLPRQPQLSRRGHRGPATPAPSLSLRRSSVPKIEDCISTIPDAQGNFSISIKVKVYPPQVSRCRQRESYDMSC